MKAGLLLAVVAAGVLSTAGCGGSSSPSSGSTSTASTSAPTTSTSTSGTTSSSKLQPGDVAVVGPAHITQTQLTELMNEAKANYQSQGQAFPKAGTPAYSSLLSQAVTILVQQAETIQQAGKLGIAVSDSEVEKEIDATKKQCCGGNEKTYLAALKQHGLTDQELRDNDKATLYEQKVAAKLTKGITVTEAAISAYYAKHPTDFQTPPSRDVRYILLGKNKAALAGTLDKELTGAGRPMWCTLAKKYSQDPSTAGKCGEASFTQGQTVPEFDKLLFSLATSAVAKVNSAQYGWFVLEPTAAATPATTTPLAKAAAKIKTTLLGQKKQAAITAWTKKTQKLYCTGQIQYQTGYKPTPDPCA